MRTRDAWRALACMVEYPIQVYGQCLYSGICSRLNKLFGQKHINARQYKQMDRVISRKRKITRGLHQGYCWPCNAEGAKKRASFCRKMANK